MLAVALVVIFAVLGLPWWLGLLLGLLAAAGFSWWLGRGALARALDELRARPLRPLEFPNYPNLVEGLSLSTGLSEPDLYVVDDRAMNGAAVAAADGAALVLTTGLLQALDRVELEGVIAALLIRLKDGDAETATLTSAVIGRTMMDSAIAKPLAPVASTVFQRVMPEHREIHGDQSAVSVTRYPPGLFSALRKIDAGTHIPADVHTGSQHLWFVPPAPAPQVPHSPLPWRLDVLSEI